MHYASCIEALLHGQITAGALEARLQESARMQRPSGPSVAELAASTKVAASRARATLAAANLAGLAGRLVGSARSLRPGTRAAPAGNGGLEPVT